MSTRRNVPHKIGWLAALPLALLTSIIISPTNASAKVNTPDSTVNSAIAIDNTSIKANQSLTNPQQYVAHRYYRPYYRPYYRYYVPQRLYTYRYIYNPYTGLYEYRLVYYWR
ncbi:hypothetical protein [Pseudanabaena sp. PCC 6802]|uniref:hypothetical protein n=1 Tax=Pseudanabaena sp. PCC 6802 TaxID=118173 RepID=UPI00037E4CAD|nr:hypothetical protein [Pseudanabaena sp. PCC 6802]